MKINLVYTQSLRSSGMYCPVSLAFTIWGLKTWMLSSFLISQVVAAKLLNISDVTYVLVFFHSYIYLELD